MRINDLAIVALTLGICSVTYLVSNTAEMQPTEDYAALERRIEALTASANLNALQKESPAPRRNQSLLKIQARLAALEERHANNAANSAAPLPESGEESAEPSPRIELKDAERASKKKELMALYRKAFQSTSGMSGSVADQEKFFELARKNPELINEIISGQEEAVATNPTDLDARMALSDTYLAKLMTVPGGPEQGIWGAKAEAQWKAVIKQDKNHWGAHFNTGNSYSYYPDFMNKTNDAISGLESALEIQQRQSARPEHAQTYLSLSRMYQRKGKLAEAKTLLETGLASHPQDSRIAQALEEVEK